MTTETVFLKLPDSLNGRHLELIGNIDSLKDQYGNTYMFIRRSVKPIRVLFYRSIAIKIYHMIRETQPLPHHLVESLDSFIKNEIDRGNLEPRQGIGFAILSQGFLSINIWGRGNVLFTQTYTVENDPNKLTREPLEKTGVACTWEQKIMGHEYELWHKYLMSAMSIEDKKEYLEKFISGNL